MFRKNHKLLVILSALAIIAALAVPIAVLALPAAETAPSVKVDMTASSLQDGTATYQIFVTNTSSEAIDGVTINAPLPAGTQLQSSYAGTPGTLPATMTSTGLQWEHGNLNAGEETGPYAFIVSTSQTSIPAVNAVVTFSGPVAGSAASASVAPAVAAAAPQAPKRGCFSCHTPGSKYTLAAEARSRAAAAGGTHPTIPDDATVATCLTCHGAGTGDRAGLGTVAPLSLRDIVHPAHMFSTHFTQNYNGNCFTCHNVDQNGNFVLLQDALATNEKGVPTNPPVMGIQPSEDAAGK